MKPIQPARSRDPLLIFSLCAYSFSFGFFFYLLIEKLYKSLISHTATHWSMGLVAGLAFLFLLVLDAKNLPLIAKALAGCLFITLLELVAGVILNLHYRMNVWDYRDQVWDLKGQICPLYSVIWFFASFAIIGANRLLYAFLFGKKANQD